MNRFTPDRAMLFAAMSFVVCLADVPAAFAQQVTRIVDGDTLVVATIGTVRLIGVDTPETVDPRKPVQSFGREASAFLKELALGQIVRLEYEGARRDRYNRTLAYAYLANGQMLNAEIIRRGFGHAYVEFPFSMIETLRQLERQAREAGRGLWAATAPITSAGRQAVFVTERGNTYHREDCSYLGKETPIALYLFEAVEHYTACKVCKPPTLP